MFVELWVGGVGSIDVVILLVIVGELFLLGSVVIVGSFVEIYFVLCWIGGNDGGKLYRCLVLWRVVDYCGDFLL